MGPRSEDIAARAVTQLASALNDAGIAWQALWVFGSAARGEMHDGSDVDLRGLLRRTQSSAPEWCCSRK